EGVSEQALCVTQQGITRDPKGKPVAWIVNAAGKVEQRALTLDRALGDKWLVAAGLAAGDRVIVEGLQKVRPGMAVKALPFGAPPAGPPGADANPPGAAPKQ
ncbi:MAG TPA: HlyD family secretion protein, partial [Acidobacteriota bacterium]|nr:HlyD family secretion protein [Acidobacteriota bacterium]